MRVAVLGPGGVGGFLAGVLARAGVSVLVLSGDETARAITKEGIHVESRVAGEFHVRVDAATQLSDPVTACLVAVKATQLPEAISRVPVHALGDGLVIPLLNGLEHVDYLRQLYPPGNVVAATIAIETVRSSPGWIRQLSPFARVEFAPSKPTAERVEALAVPLRDGGLDVRFRDDERVMLWDKLAILAPLALLTTHERGNAGQVRTNRRDDLVALVGEVAAVANADGAAIDPAALLRIWDALPAAFESSMLRDQAAGRPTELDAIGGAVLRAAAKHGVSVPVATRLVHELATRTGVTT